MMKEQLENTGKDASERTWSEKFWSQPWSIRVGEIVLGLALARYGDNLALAALGVALFVHGMAGDAIYTAIRREEKNLE